MARTRRQKSTRKRYLPSLSAHAISKTYKHVVRMREVLPTDLDWYVVHTQAQGERRAAKGLMNLRIPSFFPTFVEVVVRRARKVDVVRQLFVRYGFVGLDPKTLRFDLVRETNGVARFIEIAGAPVRVPVSVLQRISDELTGHADRTVPITDADRIAIGHLMRVTKGPFASFMARVAGLNDDGTVRAEIDVFGRPTPLDLALDYLDAA